MDVLAYWPLSVLLVFVWYQISTSKNKHLSDLSKLDTLLHKIHIKILLVLKYQGLTCLDPYYHQVK